MLRKEIANRSATGRQLFLALGKTGLDGGKTVWMVADGADDRRVFLKPMIAGGIVVFRRLRKDAALRDRLLPYNVAVGLASMARE